MLDAFGLRGDPVPLPGGSGPVWRVGGVVLKPGTDPAHQRWLGEVLATVEQRGFRLAEVRPTPDGAWVVDGWGAQSVLAGVPAHEGPPDWSAVVAASRDLHRASRHLERPALLDARTDAWAVADRAAWGEADPAVPAVARPLVTLLRAVPAPPGPAQVVHGDLTRNVLVEAGMPPGVIDVSPYWRPASWAEGIVVADALAWHHAAPSLLDALGVPAQAVARGLLFRLFTSCLLHDADDPRLRAEVDGARRVAAVLGL
ncbi:hypothetical protein ASG78_12795 [Nostocoides sp. Soil756]|nr:hypothetical protein ASG78_12795 [Tetrasphaera sp. Soil756]